MKAWTPGQSLLVLVFLGIGISGWMYGIHWKAMASKPIRKPMSASLKPVPTALSATTEPSEVELPTEPPTPSYPVVDTVFSNEFSPVEKQLIQLQDQVEILTNENIELLEKLRELQAKPEESTPQKDN